MLDLLTHWGRVTHVCVSKLTISDSDNGLSPGLRQAIIWTNARILLIGSLGTNFSEISIGIQTFSFTKMHLEMPSAKWRPFCLGLNVLMVSTFYSFFGFYTSIRFPGYCVASKIALTFFLNTRIMIYVWTSSTIFHLNTTLSSYLKYLARFLPAQGQTLKNNRLAKQSRMSLEQIVYTQGWAALTDEG